VQSASGAKSEGKYLCRDTAPRQVQGLRIGDLCGERKRRGSGTGVTVYRKRQGDLYVIHRSLEGPKETHSVAF
jgi:hypothetical protein